MNMANFLIIPPSPPVCSHEHGEILNFSPFYPLDVDLSLPQRQQMAAAFAVVDCPTED